MSPRDHQERQTEPVPTILTTPADRRNGNGKKWWTETWGKAVGSALGAILLVLLYGAWSKTLAFKDATEQVYALPPRVDALRADVDALKAKPDMTAAQVKSLAQQIADELAKKKGKP